MSRAGGGGGSRLNCKMLIGTLRQVSIEYDSSVSRWKVWCYK